MSEDLFLHVPFSSPIFYIHTGDIVIGRNNSNKTLAMFRLLGGHRMNEMTLLVVNTTNLLRCMLTCLADADCFSVNYAAETSECELGSACDSAIEMHLTATSGWVHASLL